MLPLQNVGVRSYKHAIHLIDDELLCIFTIDQKRLSGIHSKSIKGAKAVELLYEAIKRVRGRWMITSKNKLGEKEIGMRDTPPFPIWEASSSIRVFLPSFISNDIPCPPSSPLFRVQLLFLSFVATSTP
jgi:hypothetical protein